MEEWPTLNRAQLDSIRRLGQAAKRDLVVELSGTFAAEFPRRQTRMQGAVAAKNAKVLELEAHNLVGICGHLGADKMILLCERIERCARENELSHVSEMLDEILQEYTRYTSALAAYQSEPSGACLP